MIWGFTVFFYTMCTGHFSPLQQNLRFGTDSPKQRLTRHLSCNVLKPNTFSLTQTEGSVCHKLLHWHNKISAQRSTNSLMRAFQTVTSSSRVAILPFSVVAGLSTSASESSASTRWRQSATATSWRVVCRRGSVRSMLPRWLRWRSRCCLSQPSSRCPVTRGNRYRCASEWIAVGHAWNSLRRCLGRALDCKTGER